LNDQIGQVIELITSTRPAEHANAACREFLARVNQAPLAMVERLWPRWVLDPEDEKLRVSA